MAGARCPGCGAAVPENGQFCPRCGRAVGSAERPREAPVAGGGWGEFLDRCWDFFASTRVAVVLIVLLAVASVVGSLIEQESLYQDWRPPHLYYPARYGEFWGSLYLKLGLTHTYSSVWYAALVLLVVISLIICSLNRLVPLHRMLSRPQVWKLPHFLRRQSIQMQGQGDLEAVSAFLKSRGFQIRRDRECLYAERGRLSRYGPYIIHIGLIVVAFAAFAKAIPGWDLTQDLWIPDGQTVKVPQTDFAITSYKFTMETYPNGMPSRYATDLAIVEDGQEVLRKSVEVNHPATYKGWEIFQASFREEPGLAHLQVVGTNGLPVTTVTVDLRQPETVYKVDEQVNMHVSAYYHDFMVDPASNQPTNASSEIKNPAIMVEFRGTQGDLLGRAALLLFAQNQTPVYQGPFYLKTERVDSRWFTALKLHKDLTIPYMFVGLSIVLLGMVITFFFYHWQLWVREEQGRLLLGAHAHRHKFGLKQALKGLPGMSTGEGVS